MEGTYGQTTGKTQSLPEGRMEELPCLISDGSERMHDSLREKWSLVYSKVQT